MRKVWIYLGAFVLVLVSAFALQTIAQTTITVSESHEPIRNAASLHWMTPQRTQSRCVAYERVNTDGTVYKAYGITATRSDGSEICFIPRRGGGGGGRASDGGGSDGGGKSVRLTLRKSCPSCTMRVARNTYAAPSRS